MTNMTNKHALTRSSPAVPPSLPSGPSRTSGGTRTHLSPAARALVIERIIAGDPNAQINAALREAGHLPPGASLSDRALTPYRQSETVKAHRETLLEEAIQRGHAALSESIVLAAEALRASAAELLDLDNGCFRHRDDPAKLRLAVFVYFKAANFLWNRLGMDDPLGYDEAKRGQAAQTVLDAALDAAFRVELMLMVKADIDRGVCQFIESRQSEERGQTEP